MSDEPEEPPTVIAFPQSPTSAPRDAMPPPSPPGPENSSMDRLKDIETFELRQLVTKVITLRGHRKENLVWHWIACEAPNRRSSPASASFGPDGGASFIA